MDKIKYYLVLEYRSEPSVIEEHDNEDDVVERILSAHATGYRIFTNEVKLTLKK